MQLMRTLKRIALGTAVVILPVVGSVATVGRLVCLIEQANLHMLQMLFASGAVIYWTFDYLRMVRKVFKEDSRRSNMRNELTKYIEQLEKDIKIQERLGDYTAVAVIKDVKHDLERIVEG